MYIKIVMIKSEKYYETFTKRVIGVVQKAKAKIMMWTMTLFASSIDRRLRLTHSDIAEFGKHRLISKQLNEIHR